ncbi:sugar ABC transporter permease [Paenibacillus sp. S150]|uniref:ABC transporter permease n=1 Tax=Paenibacillus sp. S150 TaxID=2749826 RepID=UPI001C5A2268|nr:ABC transporter permease subunit [Paenibacillus sp. S150]MBW4083385.1 sugar ABC transporter permease [Paenibacillus sp. S150]
MLRLYGKHRFLLLMLLPAFVCTFILSYVPLYGILIAFKDYRITGGIWDSPWAGFKHFEMLFTASSNFPRVLRNTVFISVLKLLFVFPASILLALMINELRNGALKRVVQNISYLPHFLSWVILGSVLTEILSPSRGVVNLIIQSLGGKPIYFLADTHWFIAILISSDVWQSIGWGSIVYLAAIAGVDPHMYESAELDGAGRIRQMLSITLPSIMNVVTIMLMLAIGNILNAGFDQIFNLYNFKVMEVADILDTYAYRIGLEQGNYSLSTAVNLFKNVIGLILVIMANKLASRFGHTGLW